MMTVTGEYPNMPPSRLSERPVTTDGTVLFDIVFSGDPNDPLILDNVYSSTAASAVLYRQTILSGTLHAVHQDTFIQVDDVIENIARDVAPCSCPSSRTILETETASHTAAKVTFYTFDERGKPQPTFLSSTRLGVDVGKVSANMIGDCK